MSLYSLDLDDPDVYRLIAEGKNLGLFQIGEGWVRGLLKDIQPDSFDDLVAISALLRPGAKDNGYDREYADRKRVGNTYPNIHEEVNDDLEPALRRSYGMAIYQEDILEIIRVVTGWGYGEADVLFNAFRKKDLEKLASQKPAFFEASYYSEEATEAVWDVMAPFAVYSFNRAHSTAYAYPTYWTAWLKCHYPAQFLAAMLTAVDGKTAEIKKKKMISLIKEAQAEGITVSPPDIQTSGASFTPSKDAILFGLEGIRDVGTGVVQKILEARPFKDMDDFLTRVDTTVLNAKTLTALVKAGALDSLEPGREQMIRSLPEIVPLVVEHRKQAKMGQGVLVKPKYWAGAPFNFELDWAQRGRDESLFLGIQLTYPEIHLYPDHDLSNSEHAWMQSVLASRPGTNDVYLHHHDLPGHHPEGKSSTRGLAAALEKIGVEVEIR